MMLDVSPREACALLVLATALLTAWNANANGFVWDDRSAVLTNDDAQSSGLADVFSHDFWGTHIRSVHSHKSYRPLTVLSFRLNYLLAKGHSAWLYHFTNALVHAGSSALVWKVADVVFQQHQRRVEAVGVEENPQEASSTAVNGRVKVAVEGGWESLVGSLTAGLLFAVHPIHCDAVASIVGRADLLCTSLSLSAFLAYAKGARKSATSWGYVLSALVLTIAAGLCKELGFTTFALLVVYDLLRIHHYRRGDRGVQLMQRRLAVMIGVGFLAALVRVWINGEHRHMEWNILANNVVVQESRLTRMLSYAHVHAWYLWKLVWPRWLCFDYGYNTIPVIESIVDPRNAYTLLAYMVVVGGLRSATLQLLGSSKAPPSSLLMMSIAFGVVPFVPASNILFPVGTVVAERLMYFPSVGFCLLVGCIVDRTFSIINKFTATPTIDTSHHPVLSSSKRPHNLFGAARVVLLTCGALILAAGCYRSHLRNADWISEQMLFKVAVDVVPTNVKVLSNEAKNLLNPDPKKALDYLRVAIGMIPKHIESQTNAGLAFVTLAARNGSDEELHLHGIRHLYKSAMLAPSHFEAPGFIGGEIFTQWMKTRQRDSDVTIVELLDSESIAHATEFLDHAIDRKSVYPTHFYNRGSIAYESGDFDTAIRYFRMTEVANSIIRDRKVDPELLVEPASIYNMLGVSFKKKGDVDKALDMLRKGIELYPEETHLHINAVLILHDLTKTDEADAQLKAAMAAATTREHIQKLRNCAKNLENSIMTGAVEALLDRAATLEREFSSSP
ncbi:Protein O-mannosyl-transferase tmtc4 [Phytophthora pseudosyringae]|uniref:Protein O-mannosyl-transferase tmtc4 n=1 Tax=Phytophthora pseudosyringae TaxID=221518 RepID=A0A8T1VUI6_9STRA|nr:Protein O-mannosyl-transferase tmtc4 [Phytophthora pseudosyringae]